MERLLPMNEDEQQAMADLKALLLPRIARARRGEVSTQSFDEIVEEGLREADAAGAHGPHCSSQSKTLTT